MTASILLVLTSAIYINILQKPALAGCGSSSGNAWIAERSTGRTIYNYGSTTKTDCGNAYSGGFTVSRNNSNRDLLRSKYLFSKRTL